VHVISVGQKAALGLAVALSVGVSGCTDASTADSSTAASTTATAAAPAEALTAAAQKLGTETVRVTLRSKIAHSVTAMDRAGRKAHSMGTLSLGAPTTTEVVLTDGDVFTRTGSAGDLGPWMYVDAARVEPTGSLDIMPEKDLFGTDMLTKGVTSARQTGERAFAGVLDLGRYQESGPSNVPFTAKVDDQGRLIELIVDMPGTGSTPNTLTLTYSDYGKPVDAKRPAGRVEEAPTGLSGTVRH
jgi:hypothetical protein